MPHTCLQSVFLSKNNSIGRFADKRQQDPFQPDDNPIWITADRPDSRSR